MLTLLIVLVISYLLGSFPTSIIVGKLLRGIDVRQYGSRNAGATNAFRVLGPGPGIFVLAVDFAKGMAAVLLVTKIMIDQFPVSFNLLQIFAGMAAISGHIWTIFAGFKGGKGVGTAAGVLVALAPVETAVAFVVWIIVTFSTRYVSLGSLSAAIALPLTMGVEKLALERIVPKELMTFACLLAGLIVFTHRSNIRRLLKGQENRFGRKRA